MTYLGNGHAPLRKMQRKNRNVTKRQSVLLPLPCVKGEPPGLKLLTYSISEMARIALIGAAILLNQLNESPQVREKPVVPTKKTETSCGAPAFTSCERSLVLDKGNLKRVALDWGT